MRNIEDNEHGPAACEGSKYLYRFLPVIAGSDNS